MTTEATTSEAMTQHLLRVLRKYADSRLGPQLAAAFKELGEGEAAGLPAFEVGSDERIVESVLAGAHGILASLVDALFLELGREWMEAERWLDDATPDDFGSPS
jgi:hypothetical protein